MRHPSSFRDPDSAVFVDGETVKRVFRSDDTLAEATRALAAPFAREAVDRGSLAPTTPLSPGEVPAEFVGGIKTARLPFVTDPREWSFEMRRDAARLTLELSQGALADGFEMKDASAFNVLFDGCRPVFVDHGSFRESYSGHWPGYSQFGDHFMDPLLAESGAGLTSGGAIEFGIDGVPPRAVAELNRGLGRFRRGGFSWVGRRTISEKVSRRSKPQLGERLAEASLPVGVVDRMMAKAGDLIDGLSSAAPSVWRDYEASACPYADDEASTKRELVDTWSARVGGESAIDVGCNVGTFSEVIAEHFERVIAIDNDSVAIDMLYRRLAGSAGAERITPVVADIAQPTPAIGWMNRERASLLDRLGTVDLSVWLAVIHHLSLTSGIPLDKVLELIAAMSRFTIVEHISPEDESVRTMTAGLRWWTVPDVDEFRAAMSDQGFRVLETQTTSPTRTLVLAECPR